MLQVVPFELCHFDQIEWQDAQSGDEDLCCRDWLVDSVGTGNAWTGIAEDGYIVACAGVIPMRLLRQANGPDIPQESLAWAVFSPRLGSHAKQVIKTVRAFLEIRPEYKISAFVDHQHERAAPFLHRLGFAYNEDVEDAAHPNGKPMKVYSRVRM